MRPEMKLLIAAILSLSTGIAFASPLFVSHIFVVPLHTTTQGPKADFSTDLIYANFSVQPTDPNMPLPTWYNKNRDGEPLIISFAAVLNVTNHTNETAAIDMFYLSIGNSSMAGSAFWGPNATSTYGRAVKGAWLDGEWVNVTWVPPSNITGGVGYWREGVDIKERYVNGTLSSTSMRINGTWVDVTGRITVFGGQESEDAFYNSTVMTQMIAAEDLDFEGPGSSHSGPTEVGYKGTVYVSVGRSGQFKNSWLPGQSRLILMTGSRLSSPTTVEYLKSDGTLFHIQVFSHLESRAITGLDTSLLTNKYVQISLDPITETDYEYNVALGENQVFQPDQFGVEVFIKSGT